jgi:hypothetical protein
MSDVERLTVDPCHAKDTFSPERFSAFLLLFVVGLGVGSILFFLLSDTPYGIQLASAVLYSAAVIIYGFARNRNGIQPFLVACPVVVGQYPRLVKRHLGFLAVMIAFETVALRIKPHLSSWWLTASGRNPPPFYIAVALPVGALAIVEIMTNRGVLERAHTERFGEPPAKDDSGQNGTRGLFGRN